MSTLSAHKNLGAKSYRRPQVPDEGTVDSTVSLMLADKTYY